MPCAILAVIPEATRNTGHEFTRCILPAKARSLVTREQNYPVAMTDKEQKGAMWR